MSGFGDFMIDEVVQKNQLIEKLRDQARADAEKIRALEAALVVLAEIPIEAFGKEARPEYPLMGWDGHLLKVEHVLAARAALAATQSPRSEAGEDVK